MTSPRELSWEPPRELLRDDDPEPPRDEDEDFFDRDEPEPPEPDFRLDS